MNTPSPCKESAWLAQLGEVWAQSHIKCQRPRAAHSSKGLIIPELKNRAKDSFHTKNLQSRCLELRAAEAENSARPLCTRMAYLFLRKPSTDCILIRPQYSLQGSLGFFASTCHHLQFYSYFVPLFVSLTLPDGMVCESWAYLLCLHHRCVCSI